jgi:hypothetical protein
MLSVSARITLLPEAPVVRLEEITRHFGAEQPVCVCDFYLEGIELRGTEESYGIRCGNILNVDHHAPVKRFERAVSSATLAVEYVAAHGPWNGAIAINHTDCDSTLSSLIMDSILPPDPRFSAAAIAADHTGEANDIADLLQALQEAHDLDFSWRNLKLLVERKPLEPKADTQLAKRMADRERARAFVEGGSFRFIGQVAYAETDSKFDGAFLPALLPQAAVILLDSPFRDGTGSIVPGIHEVRIRLGRCAPPGTTLHALRLEGTPIHFKGRWNAGSNRRSGGTSLTVVECAEMVAERLDSLR